MCQVAAAAAVQLEPVMVEWSSPYLQLQHGGHWVMWYNRKPQMFHTHHHDCKECIQS